MKTIEITSTANIIEILEYIFSKMDLPSIILNISECIYYSYKFFIE